MWLSGKTVWAAVVFAAISATAGGSDDTTFSRHMGRIPSLDPAKASSVYAGRAVGLVYETLLEYDYEARPYLLVPGLAAAMPEVSSDGCNITFRLVTNAWFSADECFGRGSDGLLLRRRVVADDVVFSLKRLVDTKLASSGAWLVLDQIEGIRAFAEQSAEAGKTDYTRVVSGLRAIDSETLLIKLNRASPEFLWTLAMPYAAAVPHEAVEFYGEDFGAQATGSGAYRLASWRRNYEMTFERVADWRGWAGLRGVPFERLRYLVIDDVSTQWLTFLAGEIDFLGEISRDNWDAVIDHRGGLSDNLTERGIELHSMETLEVAYIAFNFDDPVVGSNIWLRRALNAAFDGARWEAFYNHRVVKADGPVPPQVAGYLEDPFPWPFSLEQAAEMLIQAGYPEGRDPQTGRRLKLTLDLGQTSLDTRESTELICAFFERIGVEIEPRYQNWPAFLQRLSRRETQMFRIGWVGDYPDALNFLQLFYGPNETPGVNRSNYHNDIYDELYREMSAIVTAEERLGLYRQMQAIIRDECPWVFIHFPRAYSLCGRRVGNYRPHDFPYGMEKYMERR